MEKARLEVHYAVLCHWCYPVLCKYVVCVCVCVLKRMLFLIHILVNTLKLLNIICSIEFHPSVNCIFTYVFIRSDGI